MGDQWVLTPRQKEAVDILLKEIDLKPMRTDFQSLRARPNLQPCPGDHVVIPFTAGNREDIWYHGIYMGKIKGKTEPVVIDNSKDNGLRESLYFSEFGAEKRPVYIIEYEDNVAKRKERRCLAQFLATWCLNHYPNEYHLLFNNCEHLATFCSTGRYCVSINMYDTIPKCTRTKFDNRHILSCHLS